MNYTLCMYTTNLLRRGEQACEVYDEPLKIVNPDHITEGDFGVRKAYAWRCVGRP